MSCYGVELEAGPADVSTTAYPLGSGIARELLRCTQAVTQPQTCTHRKPFILAFPPTAASHA